MERSWFNANKDLLLKDKSGKFESTELRDQLLNESARDSDTRLEAVEQDEVKSHFVLAALESAKEFGLRLKNPIRVLDFVELLFESRQNHQCSNVLCSLFHVAGNTPYWDPYSNQSKLSSGQVYVCRETGQTHFCNSDCTAAVADEYDEPGSYICVISGRLVGQVYDAMPQGKGVKLARTTIERYERSNRSRHQRNFYSGNQGDSDDESVDYAEDEPIKKLSDKEIVEEKEKKKRLEKKAKAEGWEPDEDAVNDSEDELEESSDNEDMWLKEVEAAATFDIIPDTEQPVADTTAPGDVSTSMPGIPKGSGPMARRRPITTPKVSGGNRPFAFADTPADPDERTAHFLKNPDQRRVELDRLLDVLLSYSSHLTLWNHMAEQESDRAHAQFPAFVRRQGGRRISYHEVYNHWLAHMATYCPPLPVKQTPLDITNYRNLILKAWWIVAHSPYTRNIDRTRIVPNLTNICLGILYTMVDGPLNFDCSISPLDLPVIPKELEGMNLRHFFVGVLPKGTGILSRYLLAKELLKEMGKITRKKYKLSVPKKAKGIRCFRDALTSTVEQYRDELRAELKKPDIDVSETVIAYVIRCQSLKCSIPIVENVEETIPAH